jgi:hypothetical protein
MRCLRWPLESVPPKINARGRGAAGERTGATLQEQEQEGWEAWGGRLARVCLISEVLP